MDNKSGLDNILKEVLAAVNQEQSMFYPPSVYEQHRNVVESMLLSELAKDWPKDQQVVDMIEPFIETAVLPVKNGVVELPENYRNLLGGLTVFAKGDNSGECEPGEKPTMAEFNAKVLASGCRLNPLVIVPQSEFAERSNSTYKRPTIEAPIGYWIGKRQVKVCPPEISKVGIMYTKKEKLLRYGYILQPDDTYIYDASTSVDTGFDSAAHNPIFRAVFALYCAYAKDPELNNWSQVLNERGIL